MQNNTFFGHSEPTSLIVLEKTSSTNDYTKQLFSNFKPQLPFTAIMAKNQTNGKGQRGTVWKTAANENLTVSFLNHPKELSISKQFSLTIISSLAVYDVLREFVSDGLSIKWPNDIMIHNKKVCGILIENKISSSSIKQSIIGIGINVFSRQFKGDITHRATSIAIENSDFNLTLIQLVKLIQQRLIHYEKMYSAQQQDQLWSLYSDRLFRIHIPSKFFVGETEIIGTIVAVDLEGHLCVKVENEIRKYELKSIKYQL